MHKFINKACAALISACMAISVISPIQACAANAEAKVAVTVQANNQIGLKSNQETENEYVEGEAVVVFVADDKSSGAFGSDISAYRASSIFGSDINVEDVLEFDVEKSDEVSQSGVSANQVGASGVTVDEGETIKIAEVSSDVLSTQEIIDKVKKNKKVVIAEPNYIYHTTDYSLTGVYSGYQWALGNNGQYGGKAGNDIGVKAAYTEKGITGTERVVAIIDTGVDYNNPNLSNNMWENNTSLKGIHGYDFVNNDNDPMDDAGHGTHCAGIIGANGSEVNGVNMDVKIMALKFLDAEGYGNLFDALSAYDYINRAMNQGVDVVAINNSWNGGEGSEAMEVVVDIVGEKGALSCCSAGNDGLNGNSGGLEPWAFVSDYKIMVAASNEKNELASFSSYGNQSVDIAAPGTNILSTVSYAQYNPILHSADSDYNIDYTEVENKAEFDSFNIGNFDLSGNSKEYSVSYTTEESFSPNPSDATGSIKLSTYGTGKADGVKNLTCIPLTIAKKGVYHVHAMVKGIGNGDALYIGIAKSEDIQNGTYSADEAHLGLAVSAPNTNYWTQVTADTATLEPGEYAIVFLTENYGKSDFYIDNIGVSEANMTDAELGYLAYYNGTSMATPYVAGAAALISEIYKNEDGTYMTADELKKVICSATTPSASLRRKTITGGVLDLENIVYSKPTITSIVFEAEDLKVTIYGKNFGSQQGTLEIDLDERNVLSWSDDEIQVQYNGIFNINHEVTIITANGYETKQSFLFAYSIYDIDNLGIAFDDDCNMDEDVKLASNANAMYMFLNCGDVYMYDSSSEYMHSVATLSPQVVDEEIVSNYISCTYNWLSNIAYYKGAFYGVLEASTGYSTTTSIVAFSPLTCEFVKVANMPDELYGYEGFGLGAMNDTLYVMGGFDKEKNLTDDIYTCPVVPSSCFEEDTDYDISSTITKSEKTLPYKTAKLAVYSTEEKIFFVGGYKTEQLDDFFYMFDGINITKGGAISSVGDETILNGKNYYYHNIAMSSYDEGIFVVAFSKTYNGEAFAYDTKYLVVQDLPISFDEYRGDNVLFAGTSAMGTYIFITTVNDKYELYSLDIPTGGYTVTSPSSNVTLDGAGYYYPGDNAKIYVSANDGYYIKSCKVDGVSYNLEENSNYIIFNNISANHTIEVDAEEIISQFSFSKKSYEVYPGKTVDLKTECYPANSLDQVTFSVNNKDCYVDNKGVFHASKSAVGKTVTVKAYSAYNPSINATTKVTVKALPTVKLSSTSTTIAPKGNVTLKATVSDKNLASKLVWTSSDTKIAKVSSKGQVTGVKYGKVTITAKLTDGSDVKAVCTVTVGPVSVSDLKVASKTMTSVTLNWKALKGVTGYKIYQYKSGKYVLVNTIKSAGTTKATVNKLKKGTSYKFNVVAYKGSIEGVPKTISVTTSK